MELQEDAYRLQQVLQNVDNNDVIKFLRTKVSLADTEKRCELALQHFFDLEDAVHKEEPTYQDELRADFLCLRHLVKSVPDEEIRELLITLGPVPKRKLIAAKLLLGKKTLKRKILDQNVCEASISKQMKITESDDSNSNASEKLEAAYRDRNQREPLKLKIKSVKDRNGNDQFMVTSPTKSRLEFGESSSVNSSQTDTQPYTYVPPDAVGILSPGYSADSSSSSSLDLGINIDHLVAKSMKERPWFNLQDQPGPSGNQPGSSLVQSGPSQNQPGPSQNNVDVPNLGTVRSKRKSKLPKRSTKAATSKFDQEIKPNTILSIQDSNLNDVVEIVNEDIADLNLDQEAHTNAAAEVVDENLVLKLIEMFPDASSEYIRSLCIGKVWGEGVFDEIVTLIFSDEGYPRRPERQPSPPKEIDPEEQLNFLKMMLPEADPTWLQQKMEELMGDQVALNHFVDDTIKSNVYPTMKEYLRKQQLSAQQRQYTTEFDVERFVDLFPDPVATFEDLNRKSNIFDNSDKYYVKWSMRNKFAQLYAKDVNNLVEAHWQKNVAKIVQELNRCLAKGYVKKGRWVSNARPDSQNIPLLQEVAYFEHKTEILAHIENKKAEAARERQNAKELGLLLSCACCYDEEVMPNDILTCTGGCRFCRDCIRKSTEVAFSEGKVDFPCLMDCGAEFSLQVLQSVLPPKIFSK